MPILFSTAVYGGGTLSWVPLGVGVVAGAVGLAKEVVSCLDGGLIGVSGGVLALLGDELGSDWGANAQGKEGEHVDSHGDGIENNKFIFLSDESVDAWEGGEDHEEGGGEEDGDEDRAEGGLDLDGDWGDDEGVDQHVEEGNADEESDDYSDWDEVLESVHAQKAHLFWC